MRKFLLGAALPLVGCAGATVPSSAGSTSHAPVSQAQRYHAGAEAPRSPTGAAPLPVTPAEPYSAHWLDPGPSWGAEVPHGGRWLDSHACPQPVQRGAADVLSAALDGAERGAIATLRITPSFEPMRSLSVLARGNVGFVIRSVQFARSARGGLSDASLATEPLIVREVELDARTAKLVRALWGGLSARSQAEKGYQWQHSDGTDYELRSQHGHVHVDSPMAGSVLGDVALAFDHFERVVNGRSSDSAAEIARAHDLLAECLERTRRREPCWRFFQDE